MSRKNMFPVTLLSSSLFLFYYTLFHVSFIFLASTGAVKFTLAFTNETDRQSLLSIKSQILDDPLNVLRSWNDSLHFCDWQGITCSAHHERVTILNLSSLQLAGSLSPHVGNLSFLRAIHLDNNGFKGTIPPEMGRLFRLQNLVLYSNSFEGGLPSSLSNCSNMRGLDVEKNNLWGEIPAELGSLSGLQELFLSKNHFRGRIPPSLGNLSSLHKLRLQYNNLEGSIPDELGQLSNFEYFNLAENNLSGEIPASLYNSSSVKFFVVTLNKLQGSPPNFIMSLPKLQIFYAAGNQFSGSIPPTIANASELAEFDMGVNKLTGSLPMNLGSLQNLEFFSVGYNQLGSSGVNDLGFLASLSNCSNLSMLLLRGNQFGGVLPSILANLSTKLISLSLGENPIYGNIPPEMGNLSNLTSLYLADTMLIGSVPNSIGKLTNLQEFYLHDTKISGKIPYSIGNLSRLSVLILRQNLLEGDIPVSLGDCKQLIALDLSSNRLTGAIPKQIFELPSLSIGLSLANNFLSGLLPQVDNMKNIGGLDVSENQLSGEIPSTLGSCQVLEILGLGGNNFEGFIPSSFQQLRGLQLLNFSRNNLSGQIPSFFGEFISIQILDLSDNKFQGEVPIKGVFKNISAFSIVGNEKLCGGIEELRLPTCPTKVLQKRRKHLNQRVLIPLVITTPIFVLLLVYLLFILHRTKRSQQQMELALPLQDQHPKLSYAELLQATNGFSSENLIGEGRYGLVYKGILNAEEQVVAVKVLKLHESGANESFTAECEALRNIRHRNLVRIITSCSSTDFNGNDFKALIYEFAPNGTLHDWLHPLSSQQHDRKNLSLLQRINVAIDVASVLDYLHHHCETTICHCDLKPSNVLLDNDFCAQLSDFGLAKILLASIDDESIHGHSIGIIGTVGYIPPEYGTRKKVSTQGDVYNYGILLLEMFTGKRPTSNIFVENFSLHNYAQMALPNRAMEIVDPQLLVEDESGWSNTRRQSQRANVAGIEECMQSILQIGVSCSAELPSERMNLKDVLIELYQVKKKYLKLV